MNVVSLFAGIGGFELGLERAGMTVVAQCEINPKCRLLLREHWPEVQQFEDVCTMRAADVPHRVDVICGGFPCQDISFAGKGAGLAGERSGLWREYARLVREFRPDYVIVENVAALLGRGLGDVLGDLAALGYDAWWDCIPASAVGAPHRRDRLWLVAYPGGVEHEGFGDALRREIAAGLLETNLAHAAGERWDGSGPGSEPARRGEPAEYGSALADTARQRRGEAGRLRRGQSSERPACGGETINVANAESFGWCQDVIDEQGAHSGGPCAGQLAGGSPQGGGQWSVEPDVGRVAHGVPARVDRLHGLGNAVVPQIPEVIGRAIIAARMSLPANQNTSPSPQENAA